MTRCKRHQQQSDPQSKGDAESSVNGVEGHVRSIKLAVESASGVEVPADHDLLLLSWLVPQATSVHCFGFRSVERVGQHLKEVWEGAPFLPWHSSVSECGGCLCSHPTVVWALWIHGSSKEGTWDQRMDRTRCLLALQMEWRKPEQ